MGRGAHIQHSCSIISTNPHVALGYLPLLQNLAGSSSQGCPLICFHLGPTVTTGALGQCGSQWVLSVGALASPLLIQQTAG